MKQTARVAIIVKAAPVVGKKHGETVCVAGLDFDGNWHRLFPIPFRDLESEQKFGRWDIVEFTWRKPTDDDRLESKHVDTQTLKLSGSIPTKERHAFARRALVTSLDQAKKAGKSFALIRPENPKFVVKKQMPDDLEKEAIRRKALHDQQDLFSVPVAEIQPAPYRFSYEFMFDGKPRHFQCIDWETEQTFYKWRDLYGENDAIEKMKIKFGEEQPKKGIVFAMGTHRVKFYDTWLLSGVIRVDHEIQGSLL